MEGPPESTHRRLVHASTAITAQATATAQSAVAQATPSGRHARRADPEQGPLQVRRQRALHRQRGPPPGPDQPGSAPLVLITMRPIPTYLRMAKSRGMPTFSEDLAFPRGLIHQTTDPGLPKRLDQPGLTAYAGFDPTADSLHVGNLLQVCTFAGSSEGATARSRSAVAARA